MVRSAMLFIRATSAWPSTFYNGWCCFNISQFTLSFFGALQVWMASDKSLVLLLDRPHRNATARLRLDAVKDSVPPGEYLRAIEPIPIGSIGGILWRNAVRRTI